MSGGSKSKSTTQTTSQDNRSVVDNGSGSITNSSGATVTITDNGATSAALDFAAEAGKDASGNLKSLIASNDTNLGKLLDLGVQVISAGADNNKAAATNLETAYQDAKGGSNQDRLIAMLGIGAVVAVAVALRK
jgi:hypothetical protein